MEREGQLGQKEKTEGPRTGTSNILNTMGLPWWLRMVSICLTM